MQNKDLKKISENIELNERKSSKRKKSKLTKKDLQEKYDKLKQYCEDFIKATEENNILLEKYKQLAIKLFPCIADIYFLKNETEKDEFCKIYDINQQSLEIVLNMYCSNKVTSEQNDNNTNVDNKTYKVGYKNPPLETRFQKGNKGNRKGRKRQEDESFFDLLEKFLNEKITVTKNGKSKRLRRKIVIIEQTTKKMLKGEQVPKNNIDLLKTVERYSNHKKAYDETFGKNKS